MEGQSIKNVDGLRKFLVEEAGKTYGQIDNATVYMYCGPLKHPGFSENIRQYMITIETEGEERFDFVPTDVIHELIDKPI